MQIAAVDLIKAVGAALSASFGVYGIGAETRDENGHLNRAGKIAVAGIIVSLVISLVAQYADDRESLRKASSDAARYQETLNNIFYDPLSTQNVSVDMSFSVPLSTLRVLAPGYVVRLKQAVSDVTRCKKIGADPYFGTDYQCKGYTVGVNDIEGNEVRFSADSSLAPGPDEQNVLYALRQMGIAFQINPKKARPDYIGSAGRTPIFRMGDYWTDATFTVYEDDLKIAFFRKRVPSELFSDAGISSFIDLLGSTVILNPHLAADALGCPGRNLSPAACKVFLGLLNGGASLNQFALMFPHNRRLFYGPYLGGGTSCQEQSISDPYQRPPKAYVCLIPDKITDIFPASSAD